ncbi:MAG: hypothetical protein EOS18_20285 [Mesorhizobium sp.]|nr:MAG: hypothetical protein EOS18_20285 [Mesorhizobium sp.]
MMTPDDPFFLEACRSFGKREADADRKADIDLTPEAIDEGQDWRFELNVQSARTFAKLVADSDRIGGC